MGWIYQAENLQHRYGTQTVLQLDHLSIERHKIVGLMGPNGSGKSTLLRLLAFVESPSRGRIAYFPADGRQSSEAARLQVTLMGQEPYLLKRTVLANVVYGLKVRGESENLEKRAAEALQWVGLPPRAFLKRRWFELSGGEAQRVALAARLVLRPKVLLLDEPTASVDMESAQRIREAALRAQRQWGTTVVVSSHDRHWLFEVCDAMLHLFKGRLVGSGAENILLGPWRRRTDDLWAKLLEDGQELVLPGAPGPDAIALIAPDQLQLNLAPEGAPSPVAPLDVPCRVAGTLLRLTLERASGRILATVAVGRSLFTAKIPCGGSHRERFYPGQRVTITFPTENVQWLV
ncbi:tungstate transport system ATP-binding protein [Desulfacinum hydrothermale DSM 13146]|uniref:Tungstate transport system ATP-binding protein n=1 Tax=Desulfacinum hydrothermale DSM 13146 TaxID=1121390 RepID=A0A1W1XDQ2_9BACT|nr:ABC transporter ATP-binding protein [Desulfacinum hydrothermale]SMC22019.1 tungstate transport system ATP-binding protein [Desulfacinum hydrothermale DSM 13146]